MSDLTSIKDEEFEALVVNADRPVILDFWAPWCGSCRLMMRSVSEIADERGDLTVYGVNIEDQPQIPQRCGVKGVPTVILFHGGQEVTRVTRATPKTALLAILDEALMPLAPE